MSMPKHRVSGGTAALNDDYDSSGPCFSTYRMDEGPIFNRIGHLCLFLKKLGLKSPDDVFAGRVPKPTWYKKNQRYP